MKAKILFIILLFMTQIVYANWNSSTDMQTITVSAAFTQVQNSLKAVDGTSGTAPTTVAAGTTVQFEGATADAFETSLTVVDPTTPDKTITLPNATGTVMLINSAQTVSVDHSFTGNPTFSTGVFTAPDINGGTMDGIQVGGTTATGELIVNDASDDADGLGSQGTSGQVLQSAGTGANPTWVAPLGVLLSTTSFSSASTSGDITITSGKMYMVFVRITSTSTDMNIYMRFSTGSTTTYAWVNDQQLFSTSPTSTLTGDDSDTELDLGSVNGSDGYSGVLFFDNAFVSVGEEIFINGKFSGIEATGGLRVTRDVAGLFDTTTAIPTNFRIIPSTGTFTGQINVYELN